MHFNCFIAPCKQDLMQSCALSLLHDDIAIVFCHKSVQCRGEPIHQIQYTADEIKTWGTVLRELTQLYPQHACREFQRNFPMFNFQEDEVPQLEDMSRILK